MMHHSLRGVSSVRIGRLDGWKEGRNERKVGVGVSFPRGLPVELGD